MTGLTLMAYALIGACVSLAFFSLLWINTRHLVRSGSIPVWLGGLIVRFALVAAAAIALARLGDWTAILAATIGFTLARWAISRWHKPDHSAQGGQS